MPYGSYYSLPRVPVQTKKRYYCSIGCTRSLFTVCTFKRL